MPIRTWDGSQWSQIARVNHWDGSAWQGAKAVHRWNGSSWDRIWLYTHVYGAARTDNAIVKVDGPDGSQVWLYDLVSELGRNVDVDPDGNAYFGMGTEARKVDSAGNLLWNTDVGSEVMSIAVDGDGNVFAGQYNSYVTKLNPDGTEAWTYTFMGDKVLAMTADYRGRCYAGAGVDLTCLDSNGDVVWEFSWSNATYESLACTENYIWETIDSFYIFKRDITDGSEIWEYNPDSRTSAVAVDYDGYSYGALEGGEVIKLSPGGSRVWTVTPNTNEKRSVAVDFMRNVYVGDISGNIQKLDPNGNLLWTFSGLTDYLEHLAADPGTPGAFPNAW